jgi:hypothetical protein
MRIQKAKEHGMPMETGRPGTEFAGDSTLTFVCVCVYALYIRTYDSVCVYLYFYRPNWLMPSDKASLFSTIESHCPQKSDTNQKS